VLLNDILDDVEMAWNVIRDQVC